MCAFIEIKKEEVNEHTRNPQTEKNRQITLGWKDCHQFRMSERIILEQHGKNTTQAFKN
jgi:hypothetical protein